MSGFIYLCCPTHRGWSLPLGVSKNGPVCRRRVRTLSTSDLGIREGPRMDLCSGDDSVDTRSVSLAPERLNFEPGRTQVRCPDCTSCCVSLTLTDQPEKRGQRVKW